jgi:hypothetical protein
LASENSGQELQPMVNFFSNAFEQLWDRSVYFLFPQLGKGVARDFFFMLLAEFWHWSFILEILQIFQNLVWNASPTQVQKQDYFIVKHLISRILLQVGRILPVCRLSFPPFFFP